MSDTKIESVKSRISATEPRKWEAGTIAAATAMVTAALFLGVLAARAEVPRALSALPWLLFTGLMIGGWVRGKRLRELRRDIQSASDLVQLDQWDETDAVLARIMRRPIRPSSLRGQALMLWAALAERRRDYESAGEIYQAMALQRIGDPVVLQQAGIALAAAKLRTGELTDAIELIGRIERVTMPQPLRAACDLVRLFQQVLMGQVEDAAANLDERREFFQRQLSTRAGYAYGLLALAQHHLGRTEEAAAMWRDATTLIPAERLVHQFELLKPMTDRYPAAEHPV